MLTIENLSKSFGPRTLWSNVNFIVEDEEMLALVGPSGAGKSTLLNCIGLLESADDGKILVDTSDITKFGRRASRLFRRDKLGYLFQSYALIDNATITMNLDAAVEASGVALRRRRRQYEAALAHVGLAGRAGEKIFRLSGGEQQRVALARLLVKNPTLILADEPTGALDEENEIMVMNILREMCHRGATVVLTTHREEVRDRCDTIYPVGLK